VVGGARARWPRDSRRAPLSHHRRVLGFDLVQHSNFTGLGVWILVDSQVLLGHFVDMFGGTFFGDFDDSSANFEISVRILRIDNCERNAGIAPHILVLLAATGRIKNDVLAVEVAPNGSDLGTAIRHESAEAGEGSLLEEIFVFLGDGVRQETSGEFVLQNR